MIGSHETNERTMNWEPQKKKMCCVAIGPPAAFKPGRGSYLTERTGRCLAKEVANANSSVIPNGDTRNRILLAGRCCGRDVSSLN